LSFGYDVVALGATHSSCSVSLYRSAFHTLKRSY
jgi:hypothetical protein